MQLRFLLVTSCDRYPITIGFVLCRTTQPNEIISLGVNRAEHFLRVCVLASASSLVDVAQCGMVPDGLL